MQGKGSSFPHPGSLLQWLGNQLKLLGKLRGSEESAAASLLQPGQTETSTEDLCQLIALPKPKYTPAGVHSSWMLKLALQ